MAEFQLALVGFDGPNQAMMEYCFAKAADCVLTSPEQADILLINGDRAIPAAKQQKDINADFPEPHKVVISLYDLSWPGFHLLKKPYSPDDLLGIIRSLGRSEKSAKASAQTPAQAIRYKQGEPLKKKLMRGKLVVNAADRLVKQIEEQIKAKQTEQKAKESAEKELAEREKRKAEAKAKAKALEEKLQRIHEEKEKQAQQVEPPLVMSEEQLLQCCGNQPNLDVTTAENRRLIYFNDEGLLAQLLTARQNGEGSGRVIEITGLPGPFFFSPKKQVFYSWFDDDFLNQLALTRFGFGELELHALDVHEDEFVPEEELEPSTVESLIWKVALWTARGRLIHGLDAERAYQLRLQPDFSGLLRLPHCDEISFLWSGHNLSAQDVMHILDIPQREVFSFLTAAYALNWLKRV